MLHKTVRLFAGICASIFLSTAIAGTPTPLDKIVAIVNDGIITQSQLDDRVNMIKVNLSKSKTPLPPRAILEEQVLEQMINQNLQLQLAESNGIHVSEEELNTTIGRIAEQNKMTVEAMFKEMTADGENYTLFRDEIREEMILHQLQQREVASTITVTPQEVSDYLRSINAKKENRTQYHVENILIALPEAPTPKQAAEAQAIADELMTDIKKGGNFRSLAVEYSNGQHALKGGDLGWRKLAELPDVFANEIPRLKNGEVAGPFRTGNGFHIIKLVETRTVDSKNTAPENDIQMRNQISNQIFNRKLNEKLQNWLMQLRANAYIKVLNADAENDKA